VHSCNRHPLSLCLLAHPGDCLNTCPTRTLVHYYLRVRNNRQRAHRSVSHNSDCEGRIPRGHFEGIRCEYPRGDRYTGWLLCCHCSTWPSFLREKGIHLNEPKRVTENIRLANRDYLEVHPALGVGRIVTESNGFTSAPGALQRFESTRGLSRHHLSGPSRSVASTLHV